MTNDTKPCPTISESIQEVNTAKGGNTGMGNFMCDVTGTHYVLPVT